MSDNNYKAPKLAYTVDCLIMLAEQGEVVVVDDKKIQLTIVQEAVEAKPDYSHLVGKWVKCVYVGDSTRFTIGKYYPVVGDLDDTEALIDDRGNNNGFFAKNHLHFDLSNPLDHNPDDVRVFDVPSEIKIVRGVYGLGLCFSENQTLFYDVNSNCYAVSLKPRFSLLTCIATECKFEDLQEGDLFYGTDSEKPDFTRLIQYSFLNNDKGLVWTDGSDINTVAASEYNHYYKITPKP